LPDGVLASNIIVYRASLIPFVFIIGSNYVILGGSLKIL